MDPLTDSSKDTTSYTMEVCGTIAVLAIYVMTQEVYSWNTSTMEHIYDSESALNRIWNQEQDGVFDQSWPGADAILVARQLLASAGLTKIPPMWVQGHADKRAPPFIAHEKINM
jgi:hypothetical protein